MMRHSAARAARKTVRARLRGRAHSDIRWYHPIRSAVLVLAVLAAAPVAAQQQPGRTVPVVEETLIDRQVREVSSQLRCVVCQGLSLQDSPSSLAQEMRAVVREQLEAGKTPDEVKAYFVEKYGEWVLLQPEPTGFNLLVYLLPVAMLLGGGAFIYFKARGWTQRPDEVADPAEV